MENGTENGGELGKSSPRAPNLVQTLSCPTPSSSQPNASFPAIFALALNLEGIRLFIAQGNEILVRDTLHWSIVDILKGHTGSVIGIETSEKWLFSTASDKTMRAWDLSTLKCRHIWDANEEQSDQDDIGDIFSLAWAESIQTLFFGCQNSSIGSLVLDEQERKSRCGTESPSTLARSSRCRFFGQSGGGQSAMGGHAFVKYAHHGYIYELLLNSEGTILFSGGGDGAVKMWTISRAGLRPLRVLQSSNKLAVLSMALANSYTLIVGSQGGGIKVYDLETAQCIRKLMDRDDDQPNDRSDVLALISTSQHIYSGTANGNVTQWSLRFERLARWRAQDAPVLSLAGPLGSQKATASIEGIITGGGRRDPVCKVWTVPTSSETSHAPLLLTPREAIMTDTELISTLAKWVSYRSVSGFVETREDCRQCAMCIKGTLAQLGARVHVLPTQESRNPIVLATFKASTEDGLRPRILFYGHYDVIDASGDWSSPPFIMTGKDGYLYGRGVSDDKGPIMATVAAVTRLRDRQQLNCDVVFLLEGEEECGSVGAFDAIKTHRSLIGKINVVLVSNSYWRDDIRPCLTYGLRGLVRATLTISSGRPDLHSGVDGGVASESLVDMVCCLAKLRDKDGKFDFPGFRDNVRPVSEEEEALYRPLEDMIDKTDRPEATSASLMAKWRFPSFTIHRIDVSGPGNSTVIPSSARAAISLRLVPDQDIESIKQNLLKYIRECFDSLGTTNVLDVKTDYSAEWWLGDPKSHYYRAAAEAIEAEWGRPPLFIREGGTIPAMRFLERQFGAPCVHIPLGQRSDAAHLPNERLRLENLIKGSKVMEHFVYQVGSMPVSVSIGSNGHSDVKS